MDRYEFRAWDGKEMTYDVTIYNGRFIDCSGADEDVFYKWPDPSEQVAFMQFTGLLDKNGKKIFEGDVCKTHSLDSGDEVQSVVFSSGSFCFSYHSWPVSEWRAHHVEVIGNIYENPDLL